MILKHRYVFAVVALLLVTGLVATAQTGSYLFMEVKSSAGGYGKLWFGNDTRARYAIFDTLQMADTLLKETEAPPAPPGFDARWLNIPGHTNTWGLGLNGVDIRPVPTNAAKKDTFLLSFGQADNSSADFTFRWTGLTGAALRCDSMFLVDPSGNFPTVNMLQQDSVVLSAPLDAGTSRLRIYKYGVNLIDNTILSVKLQTPVVPSSYALSQNYPNPFNPTTTLRFDVAKRSVVDLSVYNLLGQKVATLVGSELTPGTYTATWNGTDAQGKSVSSGVYFARMVVQANSIDGTTQQFSALRKLLLMK